MLVPMEKLKCMKKTKFETATRCYICHDPFKGIAKRKWLTMTTPLASSLELRAMPAT